MANRVNLHGKYDYPEQPVIEKILTHLGLQARAPLRAATRAKALQAA